MLLTANVLVEVPRIEMTRLRLKANAAFHRGIAFALAVALVVTWYARSIDQQSAVKKLRDHAGMPNPTSD